MTARERLLRTLRFEPVDRVPDLEFGAWEQTIGRWHKEGLPGDYKGVWDAITDYFGTDDDRRLILGVETGPLPRFEPKVLEERDSHLIMQDEHGAICEVICPELGASIPRFIRFPVENRRDWERLRDERLDPDAEARIAPDLDDQCRSTWETEDPVTIRLGSLYGWIRNWMGMESLSYAVYDEPGWVEEMIEHLTRLTLSACEKVAGKAKVDLGEWWEDMCYRSGPLLSPKHFSRWLLPRYRRITGFLRQECGCEFHVLDCDGDIHALVPLWLEGGINVMYPLEVACTDAYRISQEFGSRVALRGYFDKRALIAGKEAIDRELDRVAPLLKKGGFIPHTDHLVPPDVSWDNYCYYREKKCRLIGKAEGSA